MTKDLIIVRHASAEDLGFRGRDYDRELLSQGIMEAAKVGKFLSTYLRSIDAVFTSGALRAFQTASYISEQIHFPTEKIEVKEALYGTGPRGYLSVINSITNDVNTALLVGHNPDISYFVDYLSSTDTGGGLKKATIIHLQFDNLEWNKISQNSARFMNRIDVSQIIIP